MRHMQSPSVPSRFRAAALMLAAVLAMCMDAAPSARAASQKFDPLDATATFPAAINNAGWIVGYFQGTGNLNGGVRADGFVRAPDGTITPVNASAEGCKSTLLLGINNANVAVGSLDDAQCLAHALVRSDVGAITTFDAPGAEETTATAINDAGAIIGNYEVHVDSQATFHGFVRSPDGTVTDFDVPGALYTFPTAINSKGEIVGYYENSDSALHGFLRTARGKIKKFDVAGATMTEPYGVNDAGKIAGVYFVASGTSYGFTRKVDGTVVTVAPFGANQAQTFAINKKGSVAGLYSANDSDPEHAFVQDAAGNVTTITLKNFVAPNPVAINDKGVVTGYGVGGDGHYHGFLYTP